MSILLEMAYQNYKKTIKRDIVDSGRATPNPRLTRCMPNKKNQVRLEWSCNTYKVTTDFEIENGNLFAIARPENNSPNELADAFNNSNIHVACTCNFFKWYGVMHNLGPYSKRPELRNTLADTNETRADLNGKQMEPKQRDYYQENTACKHIAAVIDSIEKDKSMVLKRIADYNTVEAKELIKEKAGKQKLDIKL